jgi:cytochrome c oxidase subunit II
MAIRLLLRFGLMRWTSAAIALISGMVAAACTGAQSALDPAGTDSERIAHLFTVMMVGATVVWIAVVASAVYAIHVKGDTHSERDATLFIIGGGVALPTIVLGALLWYGLPVLPDVMALAPAGSLRIQVIGKQWWWRVRYVTPEGFVETANELRLPVGQRVELALASPDVIHSLWIPAIAGKMDMIPGRITRLALEPTRSGTFRGTCAEYCGASHALMSFRVVVTDAEAFTGWLEAQAQSAVQPTDAAAARGQETFLANGCSACHSIRGTAAAGQIGPDLTHLASRAEIGAGTMPNSPATLVGWIETTDRLKPGVHMPAFRALASDDLTALAAYLSSLR